MKVNYFPITFITEKKDIETQISNSVVFSELFKTNKIVTLNHYLESTQYGYTASALINGSHKLVRITDIKSNGVDWESVPFCNCENDQKFLLKYNDILITRTGGTVGKSFIVKDCPEKSVYASYLIRLRLNGDANIDFINMFLNSYLFWNQIFDLKSGAAIPNVNAEKLKKIKIPLCSIDEQLKIVSDELFLDKRNDVKLLYNVNHENSINLIDQLSMISQLRQAFLKEAMQGKLVSNETSDGKTGADLLAEIQTGKEKLIKEKKIKKQKPLPPISEEEIPFDIPENWVWCRIDDISSKIGSGSTPKGSNYSQTGYPFFRSQNIYNENLIYNDIKFIDEETQQRMNGTVVLNNDLLLNITGGSLGRCALVPNDFKQGNVSQHVCIIRGMKIIPKFYHYLVLSPYFQKLVFQSTTGAGREGLPKYNLEQFVIGIPPLEIQNRIVSKLEELMTYCDGLETSVKESQNYNEQLLQQVLREALEVKKDKKTIQKI